MNPLVSVIIPVKKGHERWLDLAIACYNAQEYPNKELLYRFDEQAIGCGKMRNRMCEESHGDIVACFDVDDWQAPGRLCRQVAALLEGAGVSGTSSHLIHDLRTGATARVKRHGVRCGSLAFWRQDWQNHPFPTAEKHEVVLFLRAHQGHIRDLEDPTLFVQFLHSQNTVDYPETREHPEATAELRALMGPWLDRYQALTIRDAQRTLMA
jgi:hypothetical protein